MPSARHQAPTYALHEQPEVAVGLLTATGVPLPEYDEIRVEPPKLPDLDPVEADAVITLFRDGVAVLCLILEIQLRWAEEKAWVWPCYLANQRHLRRCATRLLVICLSTLTARRCAQPIDTGHPEFVLRPIVIGPRDIPRVTDPDQARSQPGLAVLAALAHPRDRNVLATVPPALSPLNPGPFAGYYRLIEAALPAASRRFLEELMRTPYKSEWANKHHAEGYDEGIVAGEAKGLAEGRAQGQVEGRAQGQVEGRAQGQVEGRAKGLARAVLELLDTHRVRLTDTTRRRIEECRDENQLLTWLRQAANATSAEQLFA